MLRQQASKARGAALWLHPEIEFEGCRATEFLLQALPPFNHQDGAFRAAFVESEASDFAGRLFEIALFSEPVKIDVNEWPRAGFVFLNERECRACDGKMRRDSKRTCHSARKKRLTRAEIPGK